MKKRIGTTVRAAGKINLYLDVLSRAENGYHTIESVMQSVSLSDRVTVSAMPPATGMRLSSEIRTAAEIPASSSSARAAL